MSAWRSLSSWSLWRSSCSPGRRWPTGVRFPAPLGLILVGVVASYSPGVPTVHLAADIVLLGLLPPLLYAAAIQTSLVDFNANRRPILLLSVGLVLIHHVRRRGPRARAAAGDRLVGGAGDRRRRRATGRRRRDRDRAPDRPAASHRHDPRGRVAVQRRDRAGGAPDGHRGGCRRGPHVARRDRLPGRLDRRRGHRRRGLHRGRAAASPRDRPDPRHRDLVRRAVSRRTSSPRRCTPPGSSAWSSPACCSGTRHRSSRPLSRGSPSG